MATSLSLSSDATSFAQLVKRVTTPFNNNSTKSPATFIICSTCHIILTFQRVRKHFQKRHSSINTQLLKHTFQAWQHETASITPPYLTITTEEELHEFSTPPNITVPAMPYLPIVDAYWCNQTLPSGYRCGFVTCQIQRIQDPCRDKHNWISQRKVLGNGGRLPTALETELKKYPLPYDSMVPAQQLASTGLAGLHFPVLPPTEITLPPSTQPNPSAPSDGWSDFEEASDIEEEVIVEFTTLGQRYPMFMSPWVDHTGWVRILEGVILHVVAALLNPPTDKEPGL